MSALTTATHWDSHWHGFPLPFRVDLRSYYNYRCDQVLRDIVPRGGQRRFIDVGCGVGQWLIYFHEQFGYDVVGIDTSPAALDLARRNLALTGVPGTIIHGDISSSTRDAALEPGSFDVVYSGGLIEHFDDPLPIVSRMSNLVKPGGLHIIFVPNQQSLYWRLRSALNSQVNDTHRAVSPSLLYQLLTQTGMTDVTVRYFGSVRIPWVRRRGREGPGISVPTPAWLAMRGMDRGLTGIFRRFGFHPEGARLSQEILAFGRAKHDVAGEGSHAATAIPTRREHEEL